MKTLGIILLLAGFVMTLFTGFHIVTKKKVAEFGNIEIKKEERTPIHWAPAAGSVMIVAGVVIVIAGRWKKQDT